MKITNNININSGSYNLCDAHSHISQTTGADEQQFITVESISQERSGGSFEGKEEIEIVSDLFNVTSSLADVAGHNITMMATNSSLSPLMIRLEKFYKVQHQGFSHYRLTSTSDNIMDLKEQIVHRSKALNALSDLNLAMLYFTLRCWRIDCSYKLLREKAFEYTFKTFTSSESKYVT
jgi:hypothetical protein